MTGRRQKAGWGPRRAGAALALLLSAAGPAGAAGLDRPTLNLYGATGLIDMPSAESQPDGELSAVVSHFGGITRTTLSFQLTPRLSGSFRYVGTEDWDRVVPSAFSTFYDRSFDIRYQLLFERGWLPALSVGLQDFAGTGLLSGEYIAATKHVAPRLKATLGLGWGRLGSFGGLGAPFGGRPQLDVDAEGGQFNENQWFRGPAALFGGIEWQPTDRLALKLEYSSDAYDLEAGQRRVFDRDSPFNFGIEYQLSAAVRLGGYYLYGSEFGISAAIAVNPDRPPVSGGLEPAPMPVRVRPDPAADPAAWARGWAAEPENVATLRDRLAERLAEDGLVLESFATTDSAAELRLRNPRYGAEAQAVGRAARVMTRVLPASVETFRIVPVVDGLAASAVVLRRSDIEALETAPEGAPGMLSLAGIGAAGPPPAGALRGRDRYPDFGWGLGPYTRQSFFDPDNPYRLEAGAELFARAELLPGLVVSGAVRKRLLGNLDESRRLSNSVLPRVRTDSVLFDREGDPSLDNLTLAYFFRPGGDLYGRVSGGYLERMFGGVSAELLWKPVASRLALGAEVNYARKRDFDILFGFQDLDVVTGHVSAYYELGGGYRTQIDMGRYLAGDWGATFTLERAFANGWSVGAFATLTEVSAEEFGEGSFDKGIRIRIPLSWFTGRPSRQVMGTTLRPILRDGGARLNVPDRLYGKVRDYHRSGLEEQWGRFWR